MPVTTADRELADETIPASVGELSGDPAATAVAQGAGWASWFREPHELSATGHRAASPIGQVSWAVLEWARTPCVLLVPFYLFSPYSAPTRPPPTTPARW